MIGSYLYFVSQKPEKYKVSGPLILSGGLTTTSRAKCYHALLILGQMAGWKPDSRGEYRVSLGELHRLTHGTHKRWQDYLNTLRHIRDTVRLDWGHLSRTVGGFNRSGDSPILYDVRAELDMAGEFQKLVFVLPKTLIEDIIRPHWYGQVDPAILFSQKSNYAFHAYLFACLTTIEKDEAKKEFHSKAYSIEEWREILGVPEGANRLPSQMRKNVFARIQTQIAKTTKDTDSPICIEFSKTKTGLYQMRVRRLKRLPDKKRKSGSDLQREHDEAERAKAAAAQAAEQQQVEEWFAGLPMKDKRRIQKKLKGQALTYFSLLGIGEAPPDL